MADPLNIPGLVSKQRGHLSSVDCSAVKKRLAIKIISKEHRTALRILYEGLKDLAVPWAITGSPGFALQGMESGHGDPGE